MFSGARRKARSLNGFPKIAVKKREKEREREREREGGRERCDYS